MHKLFVIPSITLFLCAFLWPTRTVFTRLQIKVRPKGLHNFAFYILIFDFPLQSLIPRPQSLIPNPSPLIPEPWPLPPNVIVHKYLRAEKLLYNCREDSTTIESSLQINLFMQNKANFQKVKLNVNKVLTKDYDQMDTWSIRKTKPIQTQYKPNSNPIKAKTNPIQTQNKPNSCPPSVWRVKPKIQWLAKFTTAPAGKKFHLILVLHRRIMFNPVSNCEMEMGTTFAKEGKMPARQAHKLTFWDPLETLTRLR